MKRQRKSRTARLFTRIFRFREWVNYDRSKETGQYVFDNVKDLFEMESEGPIETFEQAAKRHRLSEEELLKRQKNLYWLTWILLIITLGFLVYWGYNLWEGSFFAIVLSFIVAMLAAALTFRCHYWYYQIKVKKLGCSIKEWFNQGLLGR